VFNLAAERGRLYYFDGGIAGLSYLKAVDMVDVVDVVDVVDAVGEADAADRVQTARRGRGGDGASTGAGSRWTAPRGGGSGTEGRPTEARRKKRTRHHRRRQNRFGRWVQLPHPRARTAGSTGEEARMPTTRVAGIQRETATEEAGEDGTRAADARAAAAEARAAVAGTRAAEAERRAIALDSQLAEREMQVEAEAERRAVTLASRLAEQEVDVSRREASTEDRVRRATAAAEKKSAAALQRAAAAETRATEAELRAVVLGSRLTEQETQVEFLVRRLAEQEGEFQEGVTEEEESSEEDCHTHFVDLPNDGMGMSYEWACGRAASLGGGGAGMDFEDSEEGDFETSTSQETELPAGGSCTECELRGCFCDSYEEWHDRMRGIVCMHCGHPDSSHQG
jgi:hypothetical protein